MSTADGATQEQIREWSIDMAAIAILAEDRHVDRPLSAIAAALAPLREQMGPALFEQMARSMFGDPRYEQMAADNFGDGQGSANASR